MNKMVSMQIPMSIMTPSLSYLLDTIYALKGDNYYEKQDFSLGVIIPARDEEENIKNCIDAIESQTYKPTKIIGIDDGSKDRTGEILSSYNERLKLIRHETPKGKAQSIMEALNELDTDLVVIVDADTIPAYDSFEKLRIPFSNEKVGAVCSTIFSRQNSKESPAEKFIRSGRLCEYLLSIYRKRGQSNRKAIYVASGCAVAFRTDLLKKYGIPLRTETEDLDITWLLQKEGYDVIYQPDAIAYTNEPRSLKGLKRQIGRWYRGAWQCAFLHGTSPLKSKRKRLLSTTWVQLGEGIPLSAIWLSLPILSATHTKIGPVTFTPEWALAYYLIDFTLSASPILYYGKKHKKFLQAVKSLPAWYGMRTVNAAALLYGFGKTLKDWIKGVRSWESKWERIPEYDKNTYRSSANEDVRTLEPVGKSSKHQYPIQFKEIDKHLEKV